jgi:hypothetical protein
MSAEHDEVIRLLAQIVAAKKPSQRLAGELETAILEAYPDADNDERLDNLMYILATYQPKGGEFLHDRDDLQSECIRVLRRLKQP